MCLSLISQWWKWWSWWWDVHNLKSHLKHIPESGNDIYNLITDYWWNAFLKHKEAFLSHGTVFNHNFHAMLRKKKKNTKFRGRNQIKSYSTYLCLCHHTPHWHRHTLDMYMCFVGPITLSFLAFEFSYLIKLKISELYLIEVLWELVRFWKYELSSSYYVSKSHKYCFCWKWNIFLFRHICSTLYGLTFACCIFFSHAGDMCICMLKT